MPVLALAVALVLVGPPAAGEPAADRVRYPRQSTSGPRVRPDALDRVLERAKRLQPREAERIFRGIGHQFRTCRACIAIEMRMKQIEFLVELVETSPEDDPEYPDYLFRLADNYVEMKAHYELQVSSLQVRIDEVEAELEDEAFENERPPGAGEDQVR